jgi:hypothetical protein
MALALCAKWRWTLNLAVHRVGGVLLSRLVRLRWDYGRIFFFFVNNNNFIKKGKALVHEGYTRELRLYLLLQSKKQIRSTKFPEAILGTYTRFEVGDGSKIRF